MWERPDQGSHASPCATVKRAAFAGLCLCCKSFSSVCSCCLPSLFAVLQLISKVEGYGEHAVLVGSSSCLPIVTLRGSAAVGLAVRNLVMSTPGLRRGGERKGYSYPTAIVFVIVLFVLHPRVSDWGTTFYPSSFGIASVKCKLEGLPYVFFDALSKHDA